MEVLDTKILDEITWFNEQLLNLKNTIVAWIKEASRDVDVSENEISKTEGLSG